MKKILLILLLTLTVNPARAEVTYSPEYDSCLNKAEGVTANVVACIDAEVAQQDKKLNASYQALESALTAQRQKQLREIQRLWLKYRAANCEFYYDPETSGTLQQIVANECFLKLTAQRAQELADLNNPL